MKSLICATFGTWFYRISSFSNLDCCSTSRPSSSSSSPTSSWPCGNKVSMSSLLSVGYLLFLSLCGWACFRFRFRITTLSLAGNVVIDTSTPRNKGKPVEVGILAAFAVMVCIASIQSRSVPWDISFASHLKSNGRMLGSIFTASWVSFSIICSVLGCFVVTRVMLLLLQVEREVTSVAGTGRTKVAGVASTSTHCIDL